MNKLLFIFAFFLIFGFANHADAARSFLSNQTSGTDATETTFSAVSLGTAAADRYVVAVVHISSSARVLQKITVGGVQLATTTVTTGYYWIGIGNVPTGATGDVVVTCDTTCTSFSVGLWRLDNLTSSTASDTDIGAGVTGSDTPTGTLTIDVPADGTVIAACSQIGPAAVTASWVNVDEDFDGVDGTTLASTGGSKDYAAAQTNLSITCTYTDTALQTRIAASWGFVATATEGVDEIDVIIIE